MGDVDYDYQKMYMDQCRDFLEFESSRRMPCVRGQDGYKALALAVAVKNSARIETEEHF